MDFMKMKAGLEKMAEENHREFVKALISFETHIEDEDLLNAMYDEFMQEDEMTLLNEELLELENELSNQQKPGMFL